jgi:hypothetical protein
VRPGYLIWALAVLSQLIVAGDLFAGPGATTCGELADKYRLNPELTDAAMLLWVEGFPRNVNEAVRLGASRDLAIDPKEKADRLRAYCDAHPFASFDQAVKNIYLSLQP